MQFTKSIKYRLADFMSVQHSAIFELAQVLRYGGDSHLQHVRDITHAQLLFFGQQKQDSQAHLIAS